MGRVWLCRTIIISIYFDLYDTTLKKNQSLRRTLIKAGLSTSAIVSSKCLWSKTASQYLTTPSESEGPFYPTYIQKDKDFDLTQINNKNGQALGEIIVIEGRILDQQGNPLEDATVDLWQANAVGRYRHPRDNNPAPLDPNFQGWAIVTSGTQGEFKFKTIMPGAYPAGRHWTRPPHIHFKISKPGFNDLTTQMYFPDHPLNEKDLLLQRKTTEEQKLMIATEIDRDNKVFNQQFILSQSE